ncbi:MAG: hypothetical protein AB1461_01150 [Thermodesulfobacteriota bacterium]
MHSIPVFDLCRGNPASSLHLHIAAKLPDARLYDNFPKHFRLISADAAAGFHPGLACRHMPSSLPAGRHALKEIANYFYFHYTAVSKAVRGIREK